MPVKRGRIWVPYNSTSIHFILAGRECLKFPNKWIRRRGPTQRSPRSPNLTKMDFYLQEHIKGLVYREEFTAIENIRDCITNAFYSINLKILRKVGDSFSHRLRLCLQMNGMQFQNRFQCVFAQLFTFILYNYNDFLCLLKQVCL